jgi:hypothetical protein
VTTLLVEITNDFHHFERGSRVISANLLGFVGKFLSFHEFSDHSSSFSSSWGSLAHVAQLSL